MKLFGKIFLWYLVTTALIFGVIVFVTRTFQTEPMFSRWQRSARNQLVFYGGSAEHVYALGGDAALREHLLRLEDNASIKEVKLLLDDGSVAYGTADDVSDFAEIAGRARASGVPEIDVSRSDYALGAKAFHLRDGISGVLAVRWDPPRGTSLFFDSWLGYARLLGLLVTGVVVCYALALYLTSPIRKLREATQRLAAGDLHARVASRVRRRRDELADLARDFDVMAERLESLIKSQQRLARDVSHELRSPLARLNVALEIAKQKANDQTMPVLERIEAESMRLNEMIGRLLTLSQLESGADVEQVRVDLDDLIRDIAADAEFEAQARGRSVNVSRAEPCAVVGNHDLLRSAIENVVRNAVRYTREGTTVDIALHKTNGKATVSISDHGGGVPEDELQNLFKPFYRVGEARERATGGTGLGLAIAERAVKAHKGSIAARNSHGGLSVEITLKTV